MEVGFNSLRKFQEGGAMGAEDPAMAEEQMAQEQAPEQGGDPLMQLAQMAAQALQAQDPNLAFQVCQTLIQLIQQAQGGAPEEGAQPVYRKGGKLVRYIKK